ncbi:MAG: nuclear transport factor 2 family protein [Candidatus Binatia bacterium]
MATKSTETLLQEVIDREAIRTLPVRYCHCVWQKDIDGYVNLFTKDGSFLPDGGLPQAQGHEELRKVVGGGLDVLKPRPFIHNHVVELLGPDRAKGTCYVEVRMLRDGKKWLVTGWYNDEYVKVDGEWKFKSRKITTDSSGPANES